MPDELCVLALERVLLDVQCTTRGYVVSTVLTVHILYMYIHVHMYTFIVSIYCFIMLNDPSTKDTFAGGPNGCTVHAHVQYTVHVCTCTHVQYMYNS